MAEAKSASANKQNARFRLISVRLALLINDGGASLRAMGYVVFSLAKNRRRSSTSFASATYPIYEAVPQRLLKIFGDSQNGYYRLNILITLARDLYGLAS
jgi:hypothetical protein